MAKPALEEVDQVSGKPCRVIGGELGGAWNYLLINCPTAWNSSLDSHSFSEGKIEKFLRSLQSRKIALILCGRKEGTQEGE